MRKKIGILIFLVLFVFILPSVSNAHGIGQLYALPIPLSYYLLAAASAVAISFFLAAIFIRSYSNTKTATVRKPIELPRQVIVLLKAISVGLLTLCIFSGVFGNQDPTRNFTPVFFWVYFLIGMTILSIFVGNIWDVLNPWKTLSSLISEPSSKVVKRDISSSVGLILILSLYWLELISGVSFVPRLLGIIIAVYTVVNLIASEMFRNWYEEGELFSLLFSFIGSFAPWRIHETKASPPIKFEFEEKYLRPVGFSKLYLAAILLAGTSFDSFKETALWSNITSGLGLIFPSMTLDTLALFISPLPFLIFYYLVIWIASIVTKNYGKVQELSLTFVWSLVPIAFGYSLAHSFSLTVVTLPRMYRLLSDPFGFGWNLFGTAGFRETAVVLGARNIWLIEICFVVAAHIAGVWVAHRIAAKYFKSEGLVLKSQIPLMILMIGFTIVTLWLLSQPLVISK